ncbi:hypothetical protein FQR65_LT07593 [Abscondita terminalis]|nr:hypothetical protein FQR65_LT07593 [Abscondita terminalis]
MFNEDDTLIFVYDNLVELELPAVIKNDYAIARSTNSTTESWILYKSNSFIIHLSSQQTLEETVTYLRFSAFFKSKYSYIGSYLIIINEKNLTNINDVFDHFWKSHVQKIVVLTYYNSDSDIFGKVHTSDPLHEENSCGRKSKVVQSEFYSENVSIKYESVYRNIHGCMFGNEVDSAEKAYPVYVFFDKVFNALATKINGSYYKWTGSKPNINISKTVTLQINIDNGRTSILLYQINDILPSGVENPIYFVIRSGNEIPPIKVLIMVFTVKVWIFVILTYISTSIILWIIVSVDRKEFIVWQLANIFLDVFSATLWGWLSFRPKENKIRCIFICYLIYHIHIYTAFTSNLITILTTPQFDRGISNLEELADSNVSIYSRIQYNKFLHADHKLSIYSKIRNKLKYSLTLNYSRCVELLMQDNIGLLLTELDLKYLRRNLLSNVRVDLIDMGTVMKKPPEQFILSVGHYLTNTFNVFFQTMRESG